MSLKELSQFNSLLSAPQLTQLSQLAAELSPLQLAWVSGYLAATAVNPGAEAAPTATSAGLTVLYGSQTGNSRGIAQALASQASEAGFSVSLVSMAEFKPKQIKDTSLLALVVSTHGEGDAPDDAIELHQFLASKRAPKLDGMKYSVLALGDSSYEFFCQTGKDFDERLSKLGAETLLPRVDCDVDYEEAAAQWQSQLLQALAPFKSEQTAVAAPSLQALVGRGSVYSKQKPFSAELLASQKITGRDSNKDIRHVEIDLADSGLSYQPGDALGVWFSNDVQLVQEIIVGLALDAATQVQVKQEPHTLEQALLNLKELTQLSPSLVQAWAGRSGDAELEAIAADKAAVREFMRSNQLADLVKRWPVSISAQELVDELRNITPRLYSIASSQAEVDEEVHLTVALVADDHLGEMRYGGASKFLADATEGQSVNVYVEPNNHFRLPDNPRVPVIMIGPGTGVAPFRAFLQQREAEGIKGNAWLFFGNPHFEQDFLYQTEWQQYLKSGVLERLDVAFSRDQADKIYVQHRVHEQGQLLWQWLEQGAHLYICGDAERMARDVHQALEDVIREHGGMSEAEATEYLENLRANKRYQKDVY